MCHCQIINCLWGMVVAIHLSGHTIDYSLSRRATGNSCSREVSEPKSHARNDCQSTA